MSTLTIYDRHRVDPMVLCGYLADDLHTSVTASVDEDAGCARFAADVSVERFDLAAWFWLASMPRSGWGVTA